jgi:hypothetical protein
VPADASSTLYNREAYQSGDVFPNPGRVRVSVSPEKVRVEYVRSYLPGAVPAGHADGEVAFSYEVAATRAPAAR